MSTPDECVRGYENELMRLDINLASQPYEDARQFWMRWGTAVGAVGLLTLVLLALDVTGWMNARRDRAAIAQKEAMIADRDQLRTNAETILALPENRSYAFRLWPRPSPQILSIPPPNRV